MIQYKTHDIKYSTNETW